MQRINGVHENISSPAGTYSGFKVFNEQTETAFHSANAIYINPPCSPSEAVCIYQSIVECVRPVKPFGLGLKVRMPGSVFFFFSVSTKGDRCVPCCFIARVASSFHLCASQSLTHIPLLWLWRCNMTSTRHLILIPKSYGQDVTGLLG